MLRPAPELHQLDLQAQRIRGEFHRLQQSKAPMTSTRRHLAEKRVSEHIRRKRRDRRVAPTPYAPFSQNQGREIVTTLFLRFLLWRFSRCSWATHGTAEPTLHSPSISTSRLFGPSSASPVFSAPSHATKHWVNYSRGNAIKNPNEIKNLPHQKC